MKRTATTHAYTPADLPAFTMSSHDRMLQAAKSLFATKGYENTSTAAIARAASTSESQLMKHFGSKEGLLEAIFDQAWQTINRTVRQTFQGVSSPLDKLNSLAFLLPAALEKDPELKLIFLLEGRRVRKQGDIVALSQGFMDFIGIFDGVLKEMRAAGQLRPGLHPQAVRSALIGMVEGMLRDQLLGRRVGYPAHFNAKEVGEVFHTALQSFLSSFNLLKRARTPRSMEGNRKAVPAS